MLCQVPIHGYSQDNWNYNEFRASQHSFNSSDGKINTVIGTLGSAGSTGDGGPAASAKLNNPYTMIFGQDNNIYIAQYILLSR